MSESLSTAGRRVANAPNGGCTRCGGLGYHTSAVGELAQASACECVSSCPRCGGRRHRFERNERGYEVALPCECQRAIDRVERFNRASVPARYHASTVDEFLERTPRLRELKYELLNLRDTFTPGAPGYLLWGPPGTGKTHLLAALVAYLTLERGLPCRFIDFGYLTTLIKQGYSEGKAENEIIDGLVRIPVLVVDELGKGRGNEWELTVLDALVNRRYNAGSTTFFTTNYNAGEPPAPVAAERGRSPLRSSGPRDLSAAIAGVAQRGRLGGEAAVDALRAHPALTTLEDRVGSRIYSRLHEMCHFREVDGEDMRRRARPSGRK